MPDDFVLILFPLAIITWGIISVINPTFEYRNQFGASRYRKREPTEFDKKYFRGVGIGSIIFIKAD